MLKWWHSPDQLSVNKNTITRVCSGWVICGVCVCVCPRVCMLVCVCVCVCERDFNTENKL